MEGIIILSGFLCFLVILGIALKGLRPQVSVGNFVFEYLTMLLALFSFLVFIFGMLFSPADYTTAIDPIDTGYSPLAHDHLLTLLVFGVFFLLSVLLIWLKGRELPPLVVVFSMVFLIIGCVICVPIILQASERINDGYYYHNVGAEFMLAPIMRIVVVFLLFIKLIREEASVSLNRKYKNKTLSYLNRKLAHSQKQPIWILILLLPVFATVTAILILFGQDHDSLVKVFTETTTWKFSQKSHPPYLDHKGHYLCTVAACGDPKLVKPIRLGQRHGNTIIVNRQLMIANAYEEMIQDYSPKFHQFIRKVYDKHGYNISKHINTPRRSNITYLTMKPLECFFLLNLYLFCQNPETKIKKQYREENYELGITN